MAEASNIYTTRQMVMVLEEKIVRPKTFLLEKYFPDMVMFDTELIDFDKIKKSLKLAPYVSPFAAGKPIRSRGAKVDSFKPAYVKMKTAVDPRQPLKRRPGETYTGALTPGERRDAIKMDILEDHKAALIRRKEYMAAEVMQTGKLVISGEDYPTQEVDFERHEDLTVALEDGARWGSEGVDPLDDLETWLATVQTKSGIAPTEVIFDPKAWKLARKSERLLAALDNRRQASGTVELGPVAVASADRSARYLGSVGDIELWVYNDVYEDDSGNPQSMFADYTVTVCGVGMEGVQAHGAILDPDADYQPLEIFPSNWIEKDPAVEFVMNQSAPLLVPGRPNACLCAVVHDGDFGE